MRVRILVFSCLLISFSISSPAIFGQRQYKMHFNNIVCLNPWNNIINTDWLSLTYPINAEFINAATAGKTAGQVPLKAVSNADYDSVKDFAPDGKTETKYLSNMSFDKFPNKLLDQSRFIKQPGMGKPKSLLNDRFYITYKNAPRKGMVLPMIDGDKEMFRFAYWNPTAAEGNPALVDQNTVTYYLWEANSFSADRPIGNFSINLKEKKAKGPQMVEIAHGLYSGGKWLSSAYIIEYEIR